MKTLRIRPTFPPSLVASILLFTPLALAQVPATQSTTTAQSSAPAAADLNGTLHVVTTNVPGQSISRFIGQDVRNTKGRQLGTLKDVVIDVHAGRIVFAVIAERSGETLRLVPFAALQHEPGATGLTVEIEEAQWEQVSPIHARDFETGRITIGEAERRALAERFGKSEPAPPPARSPAPERAADVAITTAPSGGSHLIPVGDLRGKRISTGNENVGLISDVVVDADRMTAAAVITPEKDFALAERKFVVPLRQLNLAASDLDPIATTLTREDFEQARQREGGLAGTRTMPSPKPNDEPALTPTGRTDVAQDPSTISISDTIKAVQHVLASEPPPSSANVQVEQKNGKLQLRGAVKSQTMKDKVEQAVRESVPNAQIENQIRVEPR